MSSPYLKLTDIEISFGGPALISKINCQLSPGDKICLVGRNGSGKSTLIKIMNQELVPDYGDVFILPGLKVGYLSQSVSFAPTQKVYDFVCQGLTLTEEGKIDQEKLYLADIVLEKLGLDGNELMGKISGGKIRRSALAKTLIEDPDILFLDEPTNHLDISAVEWLEDYLIKFKGALLTISHDRAFLETITNKTFWIDRGTLLISTKGYKNFEKWSEEIFAIEAREFERLNKKLEQEQIWLNQGISARRKRNQQRLENLYKLREKLNSSKARLNKINARVRLDELSADLASKLVLETNNLCFDYPEKQNKKKIISNLNLRLLRGEHVGVMGKNGSGKTTLIKLIIGELKPTSGTIKLRPNINISYFSQHHDFLDEKKTLWETMCPDGGDTVKVGEKYRHVVGYLKDFLFIPDQVKSPVGLLSGGERNRLLLAKILANPGNLLILDEPTNDLDMDTLDMLHDILDDYKGTLILISHDRDFIERLVTRTIFFDADGNIDDFIGGYNEYKRLLEKQFSSSIKPSKAIIAAPEKQDKTQNNISNKLSYKYKRELELLPHEIEKCQMTIKDLELILSDSDLYHKTPDLFSKTIEKLKAQKELLVNKEARWLELELIKEELERK
jgi:ABC transport system ATP-binding/permease protein